VAEVFLKLLNMKAGKPSETARLSAELRAAHQLLDKGAIFADPLALRILGVEAEIIIGIAKSYPSADQLRWFMAMRSRVAEDALAEAVSNGAKQLVILGAGLDTYAYRHPSSNSLRVFEVDHPLTQAWKRKLLANATMALPEGLTFVPIEFDQNTLADGLTAAGFDPRRRTFFSWLGVVVYLSDEAISSTLRFMGGVPGGADVVFDYTNPTESLAERDDRSTQSKIASVAAGAGERFQSFFSADEIAIKLASFGFRGIVDRGPNQLAAEFLAGAASSMPGAHVIHATTTGNDGSGSVIMAASR
jgi:methyltransferase (TIGR00027 family)